LFQNVKLVVLDLSINHPISGINDLCAKRDEVHKQILQEEEEKQKLQNDIRILTERLAKVNESLSKKMASRNEFDKTIAETEGAYMKVCFPPAF
jgi:Sjoegren syndrome nuclear autoantigen 1